MSNRLTEKQEAFCEHYSIHRKPSAAYRMAGYSPNMSADAVYVEANRMLSNPKISLRLYELATIKDEAFKVTIAQKKQWLKTIVDVSLVPIVDPESEEVIGFHGDPKAAAVAIAELNKMDGHHAPKKSEITGKDGAPIETRSMTPAEYKQARSEMLKADDC